MTTEAVEKPADAPAPAPVETPIETPAQTEDEEFAAAFAVAVKPPEAPKPAEEKPLEEKPAEEKPLEEKPAEEKPLEEKPAEEKSAEVPAPEVKPAAPAPAPAPAPEPPPEAPKKFELADPVFSDEAKASVEEVRKNYPEVLSMFEQLREFDRQAMEVKFARALHKVVEKVYSDFTPIVDSVARSEATTFRGVVLSAHKDFEEVKPALAAWIDKQPPYLRDAYKRAHDEGTAEEVVDLVTRYKEANGVKPKAPDPASPPASKKPANPAKEAAMTPVDNKRSTPAPRGPDTGNFDDAFDEAATSAAPPAKS